MIMIMMTDDWWEICFWIGEWTYYSSTETKLTVMIVGDDVDDDDDAVPDQHQWHQRTKRTAWWWWWWCLRTTVRTNNQTKTWRGYTVIMIGRRNNKSKTKKSHFHKGIKEDTINKMTISVCMTTMMTKQSQQQTMAIVLRHNTNKDSIRIPKKYTHTQYCSQYHHIYHPIRNLIPIPSGARFFFSCLWHKSLFFFIFNTFSSSFLTFSAVSFPFGFTLTMSQLIQCTCHHWSRVGGGN